MNNNEIKKPITILREEFIENLFSLINNSGLPFFVVEDILKNTMPNVSATAKRQLDIDKENYEKALKDQEQNEGKETE